MPLTPILVGAAVAVVVALLLFRWLFDGINQLFGAFGWRSANGPSWKLFHANRGPRHRLARFIFGVIAPAILIGLGTGHQVAQLLA